jgi:hypothetical protein
MCVDSVGLVSILKKIYYLKYEFRDEGDVMVKRETEKYV